MPIIALKDNPPSQLQKKSILEIDGTWWIAKVKAQQEKAFAFDLLKQENEYYLPYYTKVTKRSDGKYRKSTLVLFPSYVPFVSENPYSLLSTNRVVTILPVEGQKKFKTQLNQIWSVNNTCIQVNPVLCNVQLGDYVKITVGPMKGVLGQIIENQRHNTILLRVDGMGNVAVCLNFSDIEKCNIDSV